jgi:hypothetical protein
VTPEGRIKAKIDVVLKSFEPAVWWHKPVQNGMGSPCLDYHCCIWGHYFAIEAKAPGGELTPRQRITKDEIEEAGGVVFVIDSAEGVQELEEWLTCFEERPN